MTPERKIFLLRLSAVVAMFGSITLVELTHSELVSAVVIGVNVISLYALHQAFRWERSLIQAEWEALNDRYNDLMPRFSAQLRAEREQGVEAFNTRFRELYAEFRRDLEDVNDPLDRRLHEELCRDAGLGDQTCLWNARSRYLQCAMHPTGECHKCLDYTSIHFDPPSEKP